MTSTLRIAALLLTTAGMFACSTTHSYLNVSPENLSLKSDIRSGTARMHVYYVDRSCEITYQGTVELTKPNMKIGIPVNSLSYLIFNFSDSSLFSGSHSVSYERYLKPRSGHRYDVAISYADGMYAATIHEQSTKSRARKEIENTVPRICTTQ